MKWLSKFFNRKPTESAPRVASQSHQQPEQMQKEKGNNSGYQLLCDRLLAKHLSSGLFQTQEEKEKFQQNWRLLKSSYSVSDLSMIGKALGHDDYNIRASACDLVGAIASNSEVPSYILDAICRVYMEDTDKFRRKMGLMNICKIALLGASMGNQKYAVIGKQE